MNLAVAPASAVRQPSPPLKHKIGPVESKSALASNWLDLLKLDPTDFAGHESVLSAIELLLIPKTQSSALVMPFLLHGSTGPLTSGSTAAGNIKPGEAVGLFYGLPLAMACETHLLSQWVTDTTTLARPPVTLTMDQANPDNLSALVYFWLLINGLLNNLDSQLHGKSVAGRYDLKERLWILHWCNQWYINSDQGIIWALVESVVDQSTQIVQQGAKGLIDELTVVLLVDLYDQLWIRVSQYGSAQVIARRRWDQVYDLLNTLGKLPPATQAPTELISLTINPEKVVESSQVTRFKLVKLAPSNYRYNPVAAVVAELLLSLDKPLPSVRPFFIGNNKQVFYGCPVTMMTNSGLIAALANNLSSLASDPISLATSTAITDHNLPGLIYVWLLINGIFDLIDSTYQPLTTHRYSLTEQLYILQWANYFHVSEDNHLISDVHNAIDNELSMYRPLPFTPLERELLEARYQQNLRACTSFGQYARKACERAQYLSRILKLELDENTRTNLWLGNKDPSEVVYDLGHELIGGATLMPAEIKWGRQAIDWLNRQWPDLTMRLIWGEEETHGQLERYRYGYKNYLAYPGAVLGATLGLPYPQEAKAMAQEQVASKIKTLTPEGADYFARMKALGLVTPEAEAKSYQAQFPSLAASGSEAKAAPMPAPIAEIKSQQGPLPLASTIESVAMPAPQWPRVATPAAPPFAPVPPKYAPMVFGRRAT